MPLFPDYAAAVQAGNQNALMQMQMMQQAKQIQEQNAIKQMMSQPNAVQALREGGYTQQAQQLATQNMDFKLKGLDFISKTAPRVASQEQYTDFRQSLIDSGYARPDILPEVYDENTKNILKTMSGNAKKQFETITLPSGARIQREADTGKETKILDRTPTKEASPPETASGLRKEFTGQAKEFKSVRDSFGRIISSAEKPSAAGDLALIFNYMKMLDPGSVVRESEFATAENAAGVPEQIRAQFNKIQEGERLTPIMRQDFVGRAKSLYDAQLQSHEYLIRDYTDIASRAGVKPENVIINYHKPIEGMIEKSGYFNKVGRDENQPATPKTQADFDALPSGSVYISPINNKKYRKQ